jgi:hypothetical protein
MESSYKIVASEPLKRKIHGISGESERIRLNGS